MPDPDNLAADDRRNALFAEHEPPVRAPLFAAAVMDATVRG